MEFLITSLVSGVIGLILGVILEQPLADLKELAIHSWKRFTFGPKHPVKPIETLSFGNLPSTWLVLDGEGELEYTPDTIECHFDPREVDLPSDLLELKRQIQREEEEKRERGLPYRWDGPIYSLQRFLISRTALEENISLQLWFGPSSYFTFLATNMSLDKTILDEGNPIPLREKYFQQVDWYRPREFFSNSFGVDLAIITSDEYLLITERSELVGSRPGEFNISANEGLSRMLDRSEQSDAPDLYRCGIRGAAEELGIGLRRSDITFLTFGVDTQYSQWGLLGFAKTDQRLQQILLWRGAGVKDKWENTKIHPVQFRPDTVTQFVLSNTPWAPGALACIYHALVHEFGRAKVEAAITKYSKMKNPA